MEKNKTGKYFKYAIGEIILIVIGILIALSINNWNEGRKKDFERIQLIQNLISDFKVTNTRIEESLSLSKKTNLNISKYLKLSDSDFINLPIDSLFKFSYSIFQELKFEPLLSSYEKSISTGNIGLIKNEKFHQLIPEFFQAFNNYKLHYNVGSDLIFKGSVWELRKAIGSIQVLFRNKTYPESFEMSDNEYRDFISQKWVYAVYENQSWIDLNIEWNLQDMRDVSEELLKELNKESDH
ncbi:MAG: hypothetical protein KC469_13335 [Flavobacteriaceae bacterium]|nr:hypothetical protein [Flavobacteriaceae bacterium]